jgi:hypothetical protein
MVQVRDLTVRQWTPFKDDLLVKVQDILGANKVIRYTDRNAISLRGGKMVIEFDIDILKTSVKNRERAGKDSGEISFYELKDIDTILFWWAIDSGFHGGEVLAK